MLIAAGFFVVVLMVLRIEQKVDGIRRDIDGTALQVKEVRIEAESIASCQFEAEHDATETFLH